MLKTLKKVAAFVVLTVMAFIGLSFVTVLPAQASETSKQAICSATASETNPFVQHTVAKEAIVKGGQGNSGVNAGDIIPPFDYNFGGKDYGTYAGQNWTDENKALWANGCNPTNVVLTPVIPAAPIQTCANPNPTLTIPAQPAGINVTSAADDKGNYSVAYELPANTVYKNFSFVKDFVNPVLIATIDNRPLDALWDATKNACNMPDTGAGSIKSEHILYGGILIFAGLVFYTLAARRKA